MPQLTYTQQTSNLVLENSRWTAHCGTVFHPNCRQQRQSHVTTAVSLGFPSVCLSLSVCSHSHCCSFPAYVSHVVFLSLMLHDSITDLRDFLALLFHDSSLDTFHLSGSVPCCSSSRCSRSHFSSSLQDRSIALPSFFPASPSNSSVSRNNALRLICPFVMVIAYPCPALVRHSHHSSQHFSRESISLG